MNNFGNIMLSLSQIKKQNDLFNCLFFFIYYIREKNLTTKQNIYNQYMLNLKQIEIKNNIYIFDKSMIFFEYFSTIDKEILINNLFDLLLNENSENNEDNLNMLKYYLLNANFNKINYKTLFDNFIHNLINDELINYNKIQKYLNIIKTLFNILEIKSENNFKNIYYQLKSNNYYFFSSFNSGGINIKITKDFEYDETINDFIKKINYEENKKIKILNLFTLTFSFRIINEETPFAIMNMNINDSKNLSLIYDNKEIYFDYEKKKEKLNYIFEEYNLCSIVIDKKENSIRILINNSLLFTKKKLKNIYKNLNSIQLFKDFIGEFYGIYLINYKNFDTFNEINSKIFNNTFDEKKYEKEKKLFQFNLIITPIGIENKDFLNKKNIYDFPYNNLNLNKQKIYSDYYFKIEFEENIYVGKINNYKIYLDIIFNFNYFIVFLNFLFKKKKNFTFDELNNIIEGFLLIYYNFLNKFEKHNKNISSSKYEILCFLLEKNNISLNDKNIEFLYKIKNFIKNENKSNLYELKYCITKNYKNLKNNHDLIYIIYELIIKCLNDLNENSIYQLINLTNILIKINNKEPNINFNIESKTTIVNKNIEQNIFDNILKLSEFYEEKINIILKLNLRVSKNINNEKINPFNHYIKEILFFIGLIAIFFDKYKNKEKFYELIKSNKKLKIINNFISLYESQFSLLNMDKIFENNPFIIMCKIIFSFYIKNLGIDNIQQKAEIYFYEILNVCFFDYCIYAYEQYLNNKSNFNNRNESHFFDLLNYYYIFFQSFPGLRNGVILLDLEKKIDFETQNKDIYLYFLIIGLCACEKTETLYGNYTHAHIEMNGISQHYQVDETYYCNGYLRFHTSKGWITIDYKNIVLYESEECVLCGVVDYD